VSQSDFQEVYLKRPSIFGIIQSDDENLKSLNFIGADRRIGKETDGRFVATISSKNKRKNNHQWKTRCSFGGINESAIVGDIEVLYRVNEDGTLNLRLLIKKMISIISDKE
jgi:hypothetical protein